MATIKTPIYPIYDNGQLKVVISKGNGKLGNIPGFNTMPGHAPLIVHGKPLTNINGTCGNLCSMCLKDCYAAKFVRYHHNTTAKSYAVNTYIMRNEPQKLRSSIKEYCEKNIVKYFRFHTAGEIESIEQLKLYAQICKDTPDVIFYIYTKNFTVLTEWFKTLNSVKDIPNNFIINLSEWHGNLEFLGELTESDGLLKDCYDTCNIFAFDDDKSSETVKKMEHCPAISSEGRETGITCAQCRKCMKRGTIIAVYAH